MHKFECESGGRTMRWYEWLVGLLLFAAAVGVRAESVYKCVDATGDIAYQQVGCAAAQQQSTIAIAPAPRQVPPPHYVLTRPSKESAPHSRFMAQARVVQETAFECRASDGRLFYRLGSCPHSIAGERPASAGKSQRGKTGAARNSCGPTPVSGRRVPREQACREIHRAGAIGRDGHEFDEHVSTYERNLGHDPCKS